MRTISDTDTTALSALWLPYHLTLEVVKHDEDIPGSYWGNPEAGLIGATLYVRNDTPLHSMLHEGCHFVCMDDERRATLHTDAGGEFDEENAVCYLQILLAERIPGYGLHDCLRDMDDWGYTFRLGSAAAWFYDDAADARQWLQDKQLLPTELAHLRHRDTSIQ